MPDTLAGGLQPPHLKEPSVSVTLPKFAATPFLATSAVLFGGALLESQSEAHRSPSIEPPDAVVELVLQQDPSDSETIRNCMRREGLRFGEARELLLASEVDLNLDARADYFVRPALEPWCMAFYGAHLFRFWFVVSEGTPSAPKYRVVLSSGGDAVRVLESSTNGWHDLETVGHTSATSARTTTWKMADGRYQRASRTISQFEAGEVVAEGACDTHSPPLRPGTWRASLRSADRRQR